MLTKKRFFISVLVVFLMALGTTPGFGRYLLNSPSCPFEEPECDEGMSGGQSMSVTMGQTHTISSYVIQGAAYFFNSYSQTLLLTSGVEISDLNGADFTELRTYVDQAIAQMELARDTYVNLVAKANSTPYNQNMFEKLTAFDYKSFKKERELNSSIFNEVAAFLSNGDVRGIYTEILTRTESILKSLYDLKVVLDSNTLPDNSVMWKLNQNFSETKLFGQYAAEVFYGI
jgi:hypothetical protein